MQFLLQMTEYLLIYSIAYKMEKQWLHGANELNYSSFFAVF